MVVLKRVRTSGACMIKFVGKYHAVHLIFIFFFFQAEDGIRDFHVTGVQTCALPISHESPAMPAPATTTLLARFGWRPTGREGKPANRSTPAIWSASRRGMRPALTGEIGRASCRERG